MSGQIITTIAGNGVAGYSGDGGAATAAKLDYPSGVAVDNSGNVYIADLEYAVIRKVNTSGIISTIAGSGTAGYSGDGGPATAAELNEPTDVAVDDSGNIYIADFNNNVIRKVNISGVISTIAGNGIGGYSGDGGAAIAAEFLLPVSVAVDHSGNVYVADEDNNVIRKVNALGIISTVAGNHVQGYSGDGGAATAAELSWPSGVAVDDNGNVYIADGGNGRIRKVNISGIISTIAGNGTGGFSGDGGAATAAELNGPCGVAVDRRGNVYIEDGLNERIRKVNDSGIISTIAGNGTAGYSGDDGVAMAAELNVPADVAVDDSGNVYIVDQFNNRVRMVSDGILGVATMCAGATHTLSDATPGGTWMSGNISIATIDSTTGTVSAVAAGTVTISYTVFGIPILFMLTVNPLPDAGIISGPDADICIGDSISLTDTSSGGAWSAYNTNAVVSSGGVVTGNATGTDTIYYSITNSCGVATAKKIISVSNCVTQINNLPVSRDSIIIFPNPAKNTIAIQSIDPISKVIITDLLGEIVYNGAYTSKQVTVDVADLPSGIYLLKINSSYSSTELEITRKFVKE